MPSPLPALTPGPTTSEMYLAIVAGLKRLPAFHAINVLLKASLLELCDLREDCDDTYQCPLAMVCPRAAKVKRNLRGHALTSSDGRVLLINRGITYMLGMPAEEIYRRSAVSFYANPDDRAEVVAAMWVKRSIKNYLLTLRHGSGRLFNVLGSAGWTHYRGEQVIEFDLQDAKVQPREWRFQRMRVIE